VQVAEEIFELVDEQGAVIGTAPRSQCHSNPSLLHQAVHVMVFTSGGELVLQRRSPLKDVQPDKWDSSVGGHMQPGETPLAAARREMLEELSISPSLTQLYSYLWRTARESELIYTFHAVDDGPYTAQPEEVEELRCWSAAEIEAALGSGVFTPNFEHEWGRLRPLLSNADNAPVSDA
jgi:isopentenyldiphosphate isomerase